LVTLLRRDESEAEQSVELQDASLFAIWDKVQESRRLSRQDGVKLLETDDFIGLGKIANYATRRVSADKTYFVLNRHLNYTNICVLSCKFCDYAKKPGEAGAYEMTVEDALNVVGDDIDEVHIVGGHHPTFPFSYYLEMIKAISRNYPKVHIKAFTASEIDYFHRRWKVPPEESLRLFKEAGLTTMPGGGAEVFSDRIHKKLLPGKAKASRWVEIHRAAHNLGIKSNATLLYGHIETFEERVAHLEILRDLQDETGGFLAFIPLEYQIGTTMLRPRHTSPFDDLKMIATARLMLDNFKYIKGYWIMLGEPTAAVSLNFGANDLDGTIGEERIAHAAKAQSALGQTKQSIIEFIRDARRVPVRRDALYNELEVYEK